jgi:hypothetical protein
MVRFLAGMSEMRTKWTLALTNINAKNEIAWEDLS